MANNQKYTEAKSTVAKHQAWRDAIATTQIINRLNGFALGAGLEPRTKKPIEMTPAQIKAAEILLKKTLPDLKQIEHTGEGGGPLIVQIVQYGTLDENQNANL